MVNLWSYTLASVLLVSAISVVSIVSLSINEKNLRKILIYFVSFSTGALFGDAFIHLIPEVVEEYGAFNLQISSLVLLGIVVSFLVEKVVCWRHCHIPITKHHIHRFAFMNLFGDALHNFIDGIIIGASYLASIPVGIATTIAVILHEIPQELGDFGVLLHGGFSKGKALFYNFLTALTAVFGALVALVLSSRIEHATLFFIPFAAGTFIYIAGADLIPELHKEESLQKGMIQVTFFLLGIGVMMLLLFIEA